MDEKKLRDIAQQQMKLLWKYNKYL